MVQYLNGWQPHSQDPTPAPRWLLCPRVGAWPYWMGKYFKLPPPLPHCRQTQIRSNPRHIVFKGTHILSELSAVKGKKNNTKSGMLVGMYHVDLEVRHESVIRVKTDQRWKWRGKGRTLEEQSKGTSGDWRAGMREGGRRGWETLLWSPGNLALHSIK